MCCRRWTSWGRRQVKGRGGNPVNTLSLPSPLPCLTSTATRSSSTSPSSMTTTRQTGEWPTLLWCWECNREIHAEKRSIISYFPNIQTYFKASKKYYFDGVVKNSFPSAWVSLSLLQFICICSTYLLLSFTNIRNIYIGCAYTYLLFHSHINLKRKLTLSLKSESFHKTN